MLHLINLGAGGHGDSNGANLGQDFNFPTTSEIALVAGLGFQGARIAHKRHRFELTPGGPIQTATVDAYKKSIAAIHAANPEAVIVIDDHTYGKTTPAVRNGGTDSRPTYALTKTHTVESARDLARLYGRIFPEYKNDTRIAFEVGNEMVNVAAPLTWDVQNAFFDEIWNQGFRTNTLIGTTASWGGITRITEDAPGLALLKTRGNPLVISVHRYFDPGNEGNDPRLWNLTDADATAADLGAKVKANLAEERKQLEKARALGLKLFFGEFGLPNTAIGVAVVPHFVAFLKEFADVLWGAAPWIATNWSADDSFAKIVRDQPTAGMTAYAKAWKEIVIGGATTPTPTPPTPQPDPKPTEPVPTTSTEPPQARTQIEISLTSDNRVRVPMPEWKNGPVVRGYAELRINGQGAPIVGEGFEGKEIVLTVPPEHAGKPVKAEVYGFDAKDRRGQTSSRNAVTVPAGTAPTPQPDPKPEPSVILTVAELDAVIAHQETVVKSATDLLGALKKLRAAGA